jgi:hypothetical protein
MGNKLWYFSFFFFFLAALGFELRVSHLLGRWSYCLRYSTGSKVWHFKRVVSCCRYITTVSQLLLPSLYLMKACAHVAKETWSHMSKVLLIAQKRYYVSVQIQRNG